jgi:hypothetical protein
MQVEIHRDGQCFKLEFARRKVGDLVKEPSHREAGRDAHPLAADRRCSPI